ncbi:uncharacterized protein LOC131889507 [Tigriopus californicus]|uniref:uncharacterized protein LOC131889507 n=1 Tax=Tigriopus californicus TaxID=6832 RepID=UPI0027D9DE2F|nr:uncharacterized protein LOC131889507 [Tigriopus californicus]
MEAKRIEVAALIRAGHSTKAIIALANVSKATVCLTRNRLAAGDDLKDKPMSGRPTKVTPEAVMKAFKAKPDMPMSMMAKKKGVNTSTVSRMVKSAGGKSLRKVEQPVLSKGHQEVRVQRCGRLLNDLKHHDDQVIFFSDEKTFTVNPVFNKQNDRIICFSKDQASIRNMTMTKHPASDGAPAHTANKVQAWMAENMKFGPRTSGHPRAPTSTH